MKLFRLSFLVGALGGIAAAPATGVLAPSDAHASVSFSVTFDTLLKDADSVGVVTPVESKSVWEDGRIYTYTRVKVDQNLAGELGAGAEGWVRTLGGVVGKIGQLVDGEPVLTAGKPSLLFMRKFKQGGTWEVSARAQGQYVVTEEMRDNVKIRKLVRSSAVGMLVPRKSPSQIAAEQPGPVAAPAAGAARPQGVAIADPNVRLAADVLNERSIDDVAREIATSWKRLHPVPAQGDAKK